MNTAIRTIIQQIDTTSPDFWMFLHTFIFIGIIYTPILYTQSFNGLQFIGGIYWIIFFAINYILYHLYQYQLSRKAKASGTIRIDKKTYKIYYTDNTITVTQNIESRIHSPINLENYGTIKKLKPLLLTWVQAGFIAEMSEQQLYKFINKLETTENCEDYELWNTLIENNPNSNTFETIARQQKVIESV